MLVERAVSIGMLEGFSSRMEGPSVPSIQFADDSLFLLDAKPRSLEI